MVNIKQAHLKTNTHTKKIIFMHYIAFGGFFFFFFFFEGGEGERRRIHISKIYCNQAIHCKHNLTDLDNCLTASEL